MKSVDLGSAQHEHGSEEMKRRKTRSVEKSFFMTLRSVIRS